MLQLSNLAKRALLRWTLSRSLGLLTALGTFCGVASSSRAQTAQFAYPPDTWISSEPAWSTPRPAYLSAITDPVFGATVTRIGDRQALVDGTGGRTGNRRHAYSKLQPWNSDGSLLLLSNYFLLDGRTYQRVGSFGQHSSEQHWSRTDPRKLYEHSPALRTLFRRTIAPNAQTGELGMTDAAVLELPAGYDAYSSIGAGEGRLSENDQYVAIMARKSGSSTLDVLLYDIPACERIKVTAPGTTCAPLATLDFPGDWPSGPGRPNVDWVTVSPSGNYVVFGWIGSRGVQVYQRTEVEQGSRMARQVASATGHGDLCYDPSGNEVFVHITDDSDAQLISSRLDNGQRTVILSRDYGFGGHVSCTNYRRKGWAYVSTEPGSLEVFAVKLDGSQTVQRFAHHHNRSFEYDDQPQAAVSPHGEKVMFASNWEGASKDTPVYSYVAEYPRAAISLLPSALAPTEVRISAGAAASPALLRFYNSEWQAMTLKTPTGAELAATDLFFYATQAAGVPGSYWTRADTWNARFSFETLPRTDSASTIVITAQREGITKKISATTYPGDPLVYVVNQLSADRTLTGVNDNQLSYLANLTGDSRYASEVIIDGIARPQGAPARGSASAFMYFPAINTSLALLMAPPSQQKLKFSNPLYYLWGNAAGSDMRIFGIDGHTVTPGEVIELRYALYWNDGRALSQVQSLSQSMQSNALNTRFRTKPSIQLLPNTQAPMEARISPAAGTLRFYNSEWQAMTLKTARGAEIRATDLFFYATQASEFSGGYWTQTGRWAETFSFEKLPDAAGGSTIVIKATREGLTKKIIATVYPGDPLVYVVNQLTTDRPRTGIYDNQLTYVANQPGSMLYASEIAIDNTIVQGTSVRGAASAYLYYPSRNVSQAILMAPPNQQKAKISNPLHYLRGSAVGSDMRVFGIDGQSLAPGEILELRYALYWSDGHTRDQVNALSQRMQASELNTRFRTQ